MKIGIISDSHGIIHPEIVSLINTCDIAVHAGDIVDIKALQQLNPKQKIIAVVGNNDGHIPCFEEVETIQLPGGDLVVEHGHQHGYQTPSHSLMRQAYPSAKVIVYGHTHKRIIDQTASPWVINPGAAGEVRNHGGSSCLILTAAADREWHINSHIFKV